MAIKTEEHTMYDDEQQEEEAEFPGHQSGRARSLV
jgi:hypothetical protein